MYLRENFTTEKSTMAAYLDLCLSKNCLPPFKPTDVRRSIMEMTIAKNIELLGGRKDKAVLCRRVLLNNTLHTIKKEVEEERKTKKTSEGGRPSPESNPSRKLSQAKLNKIYNALCRAPVPKAPKFRRQEKRRAEKPKLPTSPAALTKEDMDDILKELCNAHATHTASSRGTKRRLPESEGVAQTEKRKKVENFNEIVSVDQDKLWEEAFFNDLDNF